RRPVGDVQIARLLGRVAVAQLAGRGRDVLADRDEHVVVLLRHVGGNVAVRVAVRPQDQFGVRVEADARRDLLYAPDDAAVDEVANRLRLVGREGRRAP